MVSGDSADIWARQDEFRMDASVGVPPDAFSDTGQDWGLPVYRWDVLAERDFDWLRDRAHRNADLFDGYRVDHLVGFYRTYFRPHDGGPRAVHARPSRMRSRRSGNGCSACFVSRDRKSSRRISASFPTSSARRWPDCRSRATRCSAGNGSGTSTVSRSGIRSTIPPSRWRRQARTTPSRWSIWWEDAPRKEREAVLAIPSVRALLTPEDVASVDAPSLPHAIHEALLETLFASGSNTLILPDAGHLRLARSHQSARDRRRHELDVASPVAVRPDVDRTGGDATSRSS